MPSSSRRAFLAATGVGLGSLAGCNALSTDPPTTSPPTVNLAGRTVFVDSQVPVPDRAEFDRTNDTTAADVAVFAPTEANVEQVAVTLADGTPVAVAGADAQWTLMQACRELDASYGLASSGWGAQTRFVAAVPRGDRLDTHVFVGAELPRDLPWALSETLSPRAQSCTVPFERVELPDDVTRLGTARIRGRNDVAGFDRLDSVRVRTDDEDVSPVFVDTSATIWSGEAADGDDRYRADSVALAAEFDARLDRIGPGSQTTESLTVADESDTTEDEARQVFTPETDATRDRFTACSRCRVIPDELGDRFSYLANARFRWRDPRLLRSDDVWSHHTPGEAVWYP
ncbi:hypothetical protein [Haloarcula nitratireducens]|uniref:Uncharacterized protein n=1 Tax=Haloarcula nitratireducens TaxID=2487749 RepID=A0AAW4PD53_9EURY|nr:hypothetical protein [Halomicroarcula nitratireducens]MBX0295631.1 hypothetical protein [Halomicroarcula nitratireducens]